jgi:hypothetical protein
LQVGHSCYEPVGLFLEEPDRGIACVAQQAADRITLVVMIDAKMMNEQTFVKSSLCRLAALPKLATNCAAAVLLAQDSLQLL